MIDRVIKIMKELNVDAILILNRYNIRYITGYTGDTGCVYVSKNRQVILTDFRYIFQAQSEAKGFLVLDVASNGYAKTVASLAKEDHITTIAFEGNDLFYSNYISYQDELEKVQLIPIKEELSNLRMIKTAKELENIKTAEQIGDYVFTEILKEIKVGLTELEVAAKIEYLLKSNGAEGLSFPAIVASGVNSSMPHAVPSRKIIEMGDFLTMDFGCIYNGYCSDMTRTIVIGKASDRQKEIYQTVLKAQLAVLGVLKSNMTGIEIDKIARDIIYEAGYEGCFGHGLGHGVGLFIHENPRASMKSENIVEAGMTLTIEPGIYVKNFGGVRIEDLVVITENGCENFTYSSKDLIEL